MAEQLGFSPYVASKLRHYVYRLIDPRNGVTFYVGRGQGDRVFSHAQGEIKVENQEQLGLKLRTIREIRTSGLQVEHIIHRHGMDEAAAKEVEAALIDAYPGLSNLVGGFGTRYGVMHAKQIITLYEAPAAEFLHRCILINVNKSSSEMELIDATRYAWRISPRRAVEYEYILSVKYGIIVDVFVADKWLPANPDNFPDFPEANSARFGFQGHEAPEEIRQLYRNKRVPPLPPGAQAPVRYIEPTSQSADLPIR